MEDDLVHNFPSTLTRFLLFFLLMLGASFQPAQGSLLVTVLDSKVSRAGRGRAEVLVTSDSADDQLLGFVVRFDLVSANERVLEFLDLGHGTPVDSHLRNTLYVFSETGSAAQDAAPAGAIGPGTSYLGIDASNSPVGVSGPFTRLLTTLHFAPSAQAPPLVGDSFELRFDSASSFFVDPLGNEIPHSLLRNGTLLVTPEPDTWWLTGLGLLTLALLRVRSRVLARPRSGNQGTTPWMGCWRAPAIPPHPVQEIDRSVPPWVPGLQARELELACPRSLFRLTGAGSS
ncbi:MAG: hypothetical protein ACKOFW_04990 [Planctomycetaceae bacterium]